MEACPVCRYSLRGLPARHKCPECGFRYNKHACLVAPYRLLQVILAVANSVMFLTGVSLWLLKVSGIGHWFLLTCGLTGFVYAARCRRMSNRFILVSSDELRVIDLRTQEEVIPMTKIVDAKWSRISGIVTVTGITGRELIVIPSEFLGSHRRSRRVVILVRQHLADRPSGSVGLDEDKD